MNPRFVITGTDTDIGKTIFSAALTAALDAYYWKPVQAGLDEETDSEIVARLGAHHGSKIWPEKYRLKIPASPHFAAAQEGVCLSADQLSIPDVPGPLVIEGAGGALVPLNDQLLYADLFAQWNQPVILVASTRLGTINHSLLTIEALNHRKVPIWGIAFIGDEVIDSQNTICRIGRVKNLGRLPMLSDLTADNLSKAFSRHFKRDDFIAA
ncbi:MAG: dethiobiotin synthase [Parasphingorhabdus sp.]|uniref:dethiobiotin synthase n=1 Tax=Parasphingorhabdus sp. TaxID=2709688 RepID=UPI003297F4AE